ncbi:energy transducer TonB [Gammaproteobacteria bacterium]|nr:energy transducer TonB [Gammaproteobacteria bacterium]
MKRTNSFYFLIALLLSNNLLALQGGALKNYFESSLEKERLKFQSCVRNEGLNIKNINDTRCIRSTKLDNAYYLLNNKRIKSNLEVYSDFERFERLSIRPPIFPQNMLNKGLQGYVLLSFDINEFGKTENIEVIKELCGDVRSPFAEFNDCTGFKNSAIFAAKKIIYKPAQLYGKAIRTNNNLHRFTFVFSQEPVSINKRERVAAKKSEKALASGNYKTAFEEATKSSLDHKLLDFLASKAKFYSQDYDGSVTYMDKFIEKSKNSINNFSDAMMAESFSILIASLFNQNKFNKILDYEEAYSTYLEAEGGFEELFATTNLYIAISFINTGSLEDGVFYLGLASKHSSNAAQQEYITNLFNQISTYL